ncbi:MAG TPA: flagellar assembly peptidoglycan hydrolase FlgJ [Halomonas sp.]|nr:flagellar assembly peptidoglycan hydrolase FlgJ [Halomonas sp.]
MAIERGMDGQFALEMQGLQRLKHSARQDPARAAGEAARQFEALFIQMMVKSMRQAVPDGGLLDSRQTEFYQSLLDQQWSQSMASRGIGLADSLVSELERRGAVPATGGSDAVAGVEALIAGIPRGAPRVLHDAIAPQEQAPEPSSAEASRQPGAGRPDASLPQAPRHFMDELVAPPSRSAPSPFMDEVIAIQAQPTSAGQVRGSAPQTAERNDQASRSDRPAHVDAFLERLSKPAQAASRASGVPAELILAQAAVETGWGRHEIPTRDGGNSYNLFGIKAGSRWRGETTEITTHEVYSGRRQEVRAEFRVYDSFEEAFTDYARLIGDSPRYAAVSAAASASEAAHALQRAGYATDPAYADKLIAVMRSMGSLETGSPKDTATLASAGSIGLGLLR